VGERKVPSKERGGVFQRGDEGISIVVELSPNPHLGGGRDVPPPRLPPTEKGRGKEGSTLTKRFSSAVEGRKLPTIRPPGKSGKKKKGEADIFCCSAGKKASRMKKWMKRDGEKRDVSAGKRKKKKEKKKILDLSVRVGKKRGLVPSPPGGGVKE